MYEKFFNSIIGDKIKGNDKVRFNKLFDLREHLYACLYRNEIIAMYEEDKI